MTKFDPPLSRNDLLKLYAKTLTIHIPADSPLWQFIQENHWEETETVEDTVIKLLNERLALSCQGF